jgi:hypothetical protein
MWEEQLFITWRWSHSICRATPGIMKYMDKFENLVKPQSKTSQKPKKTTILRGFVI